MASTEICPLWICGPNSIPDFKPAADINWHPDYFVWVPGGYAEEVGTKINKYYK